ncbi:hypothetical protein PHYPSEUDO_013200 [Phytophthora pseudosyringae]|uniref:Uncharacterized protein n=1 Tax=Phytophthora pseudosyringae TaxID=221518 RepID=A0A8T1V8C4_9STRA|nr:hypothetical protein PHYPSEUDO_013200 [Phytophthora pseudosyringae]
MARFGFAASKSKRQQQALPREIRMFVEHPPPQIHVEFPKLRGWPEEIDPTFAQKVLHRAYLDANASPWVMAQSMRGGAFSEHMGPADMVKRWHGTGALALLKSKRGSLAYGDIIDGRTVQNFFGNPRRNWF